jgi:iron complex outermembrane receptor protein
MKNMIMLSTPRSADFQRKLLFLSIALGAAQVSSLTEAAVLEEIIVTAQKREESLQDVPISIVAVSGEYIAAQGYGELTDITAALPNVTVNQAALGDVLFIRGIGSGFNIGFEQSVATFIDGVYFGRGLQSRNAFLDVERVEVLRGPQVTFFGNSAIAGALNITTRNPGEEFDGSAMLSWTDGTDRAVGEFSAGGPLTETLGARLALRYVDQDGWQTNVTISEDEPQEERYAGRLTLAWEPSDDFSAVIKYQREKTDTFGRPIQGVGCPPPNGLQPPAGYCLTYGVLSGDPRAEFEFNDQRFGPGTGGPFPTNGDFNDLESQAGILTLNWNLGEYTLTSVTGYSEYDDERTQAGASMAGPYPNPGPFPLNLLWNFEHVQEDFDQFSQEFRVESPVGDVIDWMAGVYYQESNLDVTNDFAAGPTATRLSNHDQTDESWSAFGSATWNATDALRLSLGLRYSKVDKEVDRLQVLAQNAGNLDFSEVDPLTQTNPLYPILVFVFGWNEGTLQSDRSDDKWTPSINLQYDVNDSIMGFATASSGFKAGGFDEQNGTLDPDAMKFEPETVDSYEIGIKSTLLDGAMTLNMALFYNKYEDLQVQSFDGVINFRVSNAASSITQGFELEMLWQMTDTLRLGFQGAYLDASYDERLNGQCTSDQAAGVVPGCDFSDPGNPQQDLTDKPLPWSPEYSGNLSLAHFYSFTSGYSLDTTMLLVFETEFETSDDNDPFLLQDDYVKVDLSTRLTSPDESWDISLIARNIFDEETSHQGNDLPLSSGTFGRMLDKPRTISLQGRYRF